MGRSGRARMVGLLIVVAIVGLLVAMIGRVGTEASAKCKSTISVAATQDSLGSQALEQE